MMTRGAGARVRAMRTSRVLSALLLLAGLIGTGLARRARSARARVLPPRARRGRGPAGRAAANSMDAWLIRKPSAAAGGSADGSPRKRARSSGQQRTLSGSSFAACPVCGKSVALALLQADHMFSAACAPAGDALEAGTGGAAPARDSPRPGAAAEETGRGERAGGGAAPRGAGRSEESSADAGEAHTTMQAGLALGASSRAGAAWWVPEEQKRLRDAQPLSPSWWEAPRRRPHTEAQQPLNRAETQVQKAQEQLHTRVLDPSKDTALVAGAAGARGWLPQTAISDVPGCMQCWSHGWCLRGFACLYPHKYLPPGR